MDEDKLKRQLKKLQQNLQQQSETLNGMLEICHDLTEDLPINHSKDGINLMIGSAVFFIFGIPAGIALHNLNLILAEAGAGLLFLVVGFILHSQRVSS